MAIVVERRFSSAARWSRRLATFSCVLLVVAGAAHRFALLDTMPFLCVCAIVAGLALAALVLAAIGFRGLWRRGDEAGLNATAGVLAAALVLAPGALAAYRVATSPSLADVSTDLADPPSLALAARQRTIGMNPVAGIDAAHAMLQQAAYPEITGRRYGLPPDRVRAIVEDLVGRRGWTVGDGDTRLAPDGPGVFRIEAVARSLVFGLASDVSIRLIDEGDSTYVDMRSASRFGSNDMGDNARRIAAFLVDLDTEVALQAGVAVPVETPETAPEPLPPPAQ